MQVNNKKKCKKSNCCDMKGLLSFLILFLLSKDEMSGEEISQEIERRKGGKPSPGTIYPALKKLRLNKLIIERKEGKSIKYKLTKDGIEGLKIAKNQFCKTFGDLI